MQVSESGTYPPLSWKTRDWFWMEFVVRSILASTGRGLPTIDELDLTIGNDEG